MPLFDAILRQVQSTHSMTWKSSLKDVHSMSSLKSPPPEPEIIESLERELKRRKRRRDRGPYENVKAKVDSSPPRYDVRNMFKKIPDWAGKRHRLNAENVDLVLRIKNMHFTRGRVDSRWKEAPKPVLRGYHNRVNALKYISFQNKALYKRLDTQGPKVVPTESHNREWKRQRENIVQNAQMKFVLFPPIPQEHIEDSAFLKPKGVKRPRVFFTLQFEKGHELGTLQAELFTEICPKTCGLFMELLAGDGVGFSYVGTHFFRKVPHLYWAGGDVACDNGFGCYAQRGRRIPIGAENYHFSHSMPGLLSMPVTRNDEMCGIFNITFKALPQLDLQNVVFGRIVRPCLLFDGISHIGKMLSTQPPVIMSASRQKINGQWVRGTPNTRKVTY